MKLMRTLAESKKEKNNYVLAKSAVNAILLADESNL